MTVLDEICSSKRGELVRMGAIFPFPTLPAITPVDTLTEGVQARLNWIKKKFFLIAEIKRSSPSGGVILEDYHPGELVAAYERGGARGISVLTETRYFQGTLEHLREVASTVELPVLQKDFFLHPIQLDWAVQAGAGIILLIVSCLDDGELATLMHLAIERGLLPLTEVHTAEELDRALSLGAPLIGINNRDLKTLKVDLATSFRLIQKVPEGTLVISESGCTERSEIMALEAAGFAGALVGTHLLKSGDPEGAVRRLLGTTGDPG